MPKSGSGQGGQGQGQGGGQGSGAAGAGSRRGRMGGMRQNAGPGGTCVCPNCGANLPHQQGNPCYQQKCPQCGTMMIRG
jgi:hypothetical protein